MIAVRIATDLGRIIARRWMILLTWWLAGVVLRDLVLQAAAQVAGFSVFLATMVLSLAMLTRLVVFVAMLLVVRDELDGVAEPAPEGRGAFARAVIGASVPFALFYYVSGLLEEDRRAFVELAGSFHIWEWADKDIQIDAVGLNIPTAIVIVVCLALRLSWGRMHTRLPWWIGGGAVLLEVIWIFFTEHLLDDAVSTLLAWLQTRQVAVWAEDAGAAIAAIAAPLEAIWSAAGPLVAIAFDALFVPVAWMLAAATVYGRSLSEISDDAPAAPAGRRLSGARVGTAVVKEAIDQTETLRDAVRLIRGTGPILIAAYCLLYSLIGLAEPLVMFLVTRAMGPHDKFSLLGSLIPFVALIPTMIVTPILIALVAAACNIAIAHLTERRDATGAGSPVKREEDLLRDGVGGDVDLDDELVRDVAGDDEQGAQLPRS
jgi:hypothetical protein